MGSPKAIIRLKTFNKNTVSGAHPQACNNQQILHAWNAAGTVGVGEILACAAPIPSTQTPAQAAHRVWQSRAGQADTWLIHHSWRGVIWCEEVGKDCAKHGGGDYVIGSERASISTRQELPSWLHEAKN